MYWLRSREIIEYDSSVSNGCKTLDRRHIYNYKDILISLKNILGTRRGSVIHLPDYGLPDLSYIYNNMPESLASYILDIIKTAKKYEPRILNLVAINYKLTKSNKINIHFRAETIIYKTISINTCISPSGKIEILDQRSNYAC